MTDKIRSGALQPTLSPGKSKSVLESAGSIYGSLITRFFQEVGKHLKPKGRIQLVSSTLGDVPRLKKLLEQDGFKVRVVPEMNFVYALEMLP